MSVDHNIMLLLREIDDAEFRGQGGLILSDTPVRRKAKRAGFIRAGRFSKSGHSRLWILTAAGRSELGPR